MGNNVLKRSKLKIMFMLIGVVKPLIHIMIFAVVLGVFGFLCAIGIPVIAGYGIVETMGYEGVNIKTLVIAICTFAVLRGIFRYGEQACNHYIAFKILAIIRNKVFIALRRLSPAKMEGKKKGDLIAILTSDIELLEVFYAHTISPIIIAILTSLIMCIWLWIIHPILSIIALIAYIVIGYVIPSNLSKKGVNIGLEYRNEFSDLNSTVFDSLRGIDEILQYGYADKQYEKIKKKENELNKAGNKLKNLEGIQRGITDGSILGLSLIMLICSSILYNLGNIDFGEIIASTIIMTSSFGPVVALSNLSNNLNQTLASGERVLDILEEEPIVNEIKEKEKSQFGDVNISEVTFSYNEKETILKDINIKLPQNTVLGIFGKSGCGKSTLLKLLMRFWETDTGEISIANKSINSINTDELRDMQSYVTQETWLFNDSIFSNVAIAKQDATLDEVKESCVKAGIHDLIESLPQKYDTNIGELGDNLSGGERQRLGIARAFLHDSPMVLLDEPTSNLDSLNESYLLNSIEKLGESKTVILVSHRLSTMGVAKEIFKMKNQRSS